MIAELNFPLPTRLANYRTTSYEYYYELRKKLGSIEFNELRNKINKRIEDLEPGRRYDLFLLPEDKEEAFVKFACYYIIEHGGIDTCGLRFSDDWRYLIKSKNHGQR